MERMIFITGGGSCPDLCAGDESGCSGLSAEAISATKTFLRALERALERSREQWLQRLERKEVRDRLATLTPREFEVLNGVIAGMLNKQIAAQFGTTEGTIKVHRGRVMEKMGVTSVAELVILAQRAGIAPPARPQEPQAR